MKVAWLEATVGPWSSARCLQRCGDRGSMRLTLAPPQGLPWMCSGWLWRAEGRRGRGRGVEAVPRGRRRRVRVVWLGVWVGLWSPAPPLGLLLT